ncbi:MAG: 50S ribosomal protein L25 [Phycisphaerae bacterium]|nr:50S ribosomal protein L25 [Phycisphaerae bacterium]NIX29965.1 50S ribosomal protein L25 [Phycisphaerae bacterium]
MGKQAKQLRRNGIIPAVIYGQGTNVHIQIENLSLRRALRAAGTTNLIDVNIDGGGKRTVLAREVQAHPTRGDLIHVDFYEVNMKEKIVVDAALVAVGTAAPVADGLGSTPQILFSVQIECLPDNLISEIEFDLTKIETPDDVITVADLVVPDDVDILDDPEEVVARFEYLTLEEEEEEEEEESFLESAADEVEVIGKGKQDEEEEEDFE